MIFQSDLFLQLVWSFLQWPSLDKHVRECCKQQHQTVRCVKRCQCLRDSSKCCKSKSNRVVGYFMLRCVSLAGSFFCFFCLLPLTHRTQHGIFGAGPAPVCTLVRSCPEHTIMKIGSPPHSWALTSVRDPQCYRTSSISLSLSPPSSCLAYIRTYIQRTYTVARRHRPTCTWEWETLGESSLTGPACDRAFCHLTLPCCWPVTCAHKHT